MFVLPTFIAAIAAAPSGLAAGEVPLGQIAPVADAYSKGSTTTAGALANVELLISNTLGAATVLGGLFFLTYFFLGAFSWISAGADKGKIEKARSEMVNSAVGMVILIASYAIIGLVSSLIGFNILDIGGQLGKLIPGSAGAGVPTPTP